MHLLFYGEAQTLRLDIQGYKRTALWIILAKISPVETTEIMHSQRSIYSIKSLICIEIKACNGMALDSHSKQYLGEQEQRI